eukprot:TRINITY_DN14459_c0_g1_i3.p1 TRINITY_DN14459_c0_g1~~TRINITY_DN14459_c0_g1_i3.p1  ORF type:complete len:150 (-),score=24.09 TRINITY_DN14459_c0_g1_i3:227-676(-)
MPLPDPSAYMNHCDITERQAADLTLNAFSRGNLLTCAVEPGAFLGDGASNALSKVWCKQEIRSPYQKLLWLMNTFLFEIWQGCFYCALRMMFAEKLNQGLTFLPDTIPNLIISSAKLFHQAVSCLAPEKAVGSTTHEFVLLWDLPHSCL